MIFEQLEIKGLSHFSYIVGSEDTHKIVVVDPKRDVDTYLDYAKKHNLSIAYVLETHIHADYASGAYELAEKSGAELCLSRYDEKEQFEVTFPHRRLSHKEVLELGSLKIQALHTPGHTPEHLSFLVTEAADQRLLSGDFLFIGAVGRPDLLGEKETNALAERLYESIHTVLPELSDDVKVFPAHGAGSMCGAGMKAALHSTLGAERTSNKFLSKNLSKAEFLDLLLSSVPPLPPYYKRMKVLNSKGAPHLLAFPGATPLPLDKFEQKISSGAIVIDARDSDQFGEGHIPNSFGIGAGASFSTWAAWVLPADGRIVLVSPSNDAVQELSRALIRVGFDNIEGYLDGGFETWLKAGKPVRTLPQITATELNERLQKKEEIGVLDVRYESEWRSGHIQGSQHLMAGEIQALAHNLPDKNKTLAVICGGGYRSTVASSVLERLGFKFLLNVKGGMGAWNKI